MKKIEGNLIELAKQGEFDVIAHGCNCYNVMGAGIAAQIKKEFPSVWEADCIISKELMPNKKLGNYSSDVVFLESGQPLIVINAYTQLAFGKGARHVSYDAIASVFERLNNNLSSLNYQGDDVVIKVGIPMIGAGLGGGNWDIIEKIIDIYTPDLEVTLVTLP